MSHTCVCVSVSVAASHGGSDITVFIGLFCKKKKKKKKEYLTSSLHPLNNFTTDDRVHMFISYIPTVPSDSDSNITAAASENTER